MTQYKIVSLDQNLKDCSPFTSRPYDALFHYYFKQELTHLVDHSHNIPTSKIQATFGDLYFKELFQYFTANLPHSKHKSLVLNSLCTSRNQFIYSYHCKLDKALIPKQHFKKMNETLVSIRNDYQTCIKQLIESFNHSHPRSSIIEKAMEAHLANVLIDISSNPEPFQSYHETIQMYLFRHFASFCITENCTLNDFLPTYDRFTVIMLSNANS